MAGEMLEALGTHTCAASLGLQVSRQLKETKAAALRNENELQQLAATIQHHRRQNIALSERIARIEAQVIPLTFVLPRPSPIPDFLFPAATSASL